MLVRRSPPKSTGPSSSTMTSVPLSGEVRRAPLTRTARHYGAVTRGPDETALDAVWKFVPVHTGPFCRDVDR